MSDSPDERLAIGGNQPPLVELLQEEAAPLAARRDELLGAVSRAPEAVLDEDQSGKIADLIKTINVCIKAAETARVTRKEEFLVAGRQVDAVYKRITEPLDAAKRSVEQRLTAYQRQKAEEERRRREEEARRQAEEAERQRLEAEAAAQAIQTEADLEAALTAEELAKHALADADKARREAEAKDAELSRIRGELGSVSSLRSYWTFADLDRAKIDLEVLRSFFATADIEKAIRIFIRGGGRELRGCRIFQDVSSVVRG